MRPSSACLVTPYTPLGIVDLELAFNLSRAELVVNTWRENQCNNSLALVSSGLAAAVLNIIVDFAFIAAYVWFFIVLTILSSRKSENPGWATVLIVCVCLIFGALDIIENLFMLLFIYFQSLSTYTFALPAVIKFGLILCVIPILLTRFLVNLVGSFKS